MAPASNAASEIPLYNPAQISTTQLLILEQPHGILYDTDENLRLLQGNYLNLFDKKVKNNTRFKPGYDVFIDRSST